MHATNKIASRKIIHNDSGRQDLLSRVLGSASSGHAIKIGQAHRTVAVALSVAMTMTGTHLAAAEELKRWKNVASCKHEVIFCCSQLHITAFFFWKLPHQNLFRKSVTFMRFLIQSWVTYAHKSRKIVRVEYSPSHKLGQAFVFWHYNYCSLLLLFIFFTRMLWHIFT